MNKEETHKQQNDENETSELKKQKNNDEKNNDETNRGEMGNDETLKKQYDEIRETLQRVYAEFQNYKKRTDEDKTRFIKLSNEELIKKILPIMDNFELALQHNKQENEFSKGIEMIYTQLKDILEDEGIQEINARGQFNPELHEALLIEESEKESGIILEQLQKGYKIGDKIIRHAKVKISKKINGGN